MVQRRKLADVMNAKKFVCLTGEVTAAVAAKKMLERQVGAIAVLEAGVLCGILTERDINFRVVAIGRDPTKTSLIDVMTRDPKTLSADTTLGDALDLMQKYGHRHVPVVEDGKPIGIVSLRDIFMEVKRGMEQDIQESEQFIVGSETAH